MKIAIVRGGFAGVAAQRKAWKLEREAEDLAASIERRQLDLEASRVRLSKLRVQAVEAAAVARGYEQ